MNLKKINKNNSSWKTSLFLLTFFCFLIPFFSSYADISKQINYQGKLTDSTNSAVPDGSYDMTFKLYDASTSGILLWTGTHTTANSNPVTVTNGIFSVLLGSGTGNTLALDFNSNSYYLQVEIYNSDTTTWETLSPRKQLGSTPSSFNSDRLDGLDSAESGANAHIVKTDSSGNLTISGNTYFNGTAYYINSTGTANLNGLTLAGNLNVNNNQFLVNTSTGYIGIGTGTPTTALDVNGTVTATAFIGDGSGLTNLPVGLDGATWLTGTDTPPSSLIGVDNDFYYNTSTYEVYKKTTGSWGSVGNIKGADGVNGINGRGTSWLYGTDVPNVSDGDPADFYYNQSTSDVYIKDDSTYGTSNLLTGSVTTASCDNTNAWKTIDGSTGIGWRCGKYETNLYYDLGFGNNEAISRIRINADNNGSNAIRNFIFWGSNDNSQWISLLSTTYPSSGTDHTFDFINTTEFRYYRLNILTTYSPNLTAITEMRAYGLTEANWRLAANIKGADGADGVDGTNSLWANDGTNMSFMTGNVGIGDASPSALLTVGNGDLFQVNATGDVLGQSFNNLTLVQNADGFEISGGSTDSRTLTILGENITLDQSLATTDSPTFGGLTLSGLTEGSIPFIGADGIISENNSNLFWDNTNQRLGIGTENPQANLDMRGLITALRDITGIGIMNNFSGGGINNLVAAFQMDADVQNGIAYVSAGDNSNPMWQEYIKTRSLDGTTPAIVHNGDELGSFRFYGDDGVGLTVGAEIVVTVDGDPGSNDMPGRIGFFTVSSGVSGTRERLRIANNGNVGIGDLSPYSLLTVGDGDLFQVNGLGNVLGGTYNSLTLTSATDGFTISGGSTDSRNLTILGDDITLDQSLATTDSPTFAGLTISGLTQGSVPFIGASGVISQDNSNLFWDNTNKRLGIGTSAPDYDLDVSGSLRTKNLIADNLILGGYSNSIINSYNGFSGYVNFSGGLGIGGIQRITNEGNLTNIGTIQAGEMKLTSGGTFAAKIDYVVGDAPFSVAVGDINGDGKNDLSVANNDSDSVSVLLNNGDGTFASKVDYMAGDFPISVSTGDLNSDGKEDLAVANRDSDSISILLNNGDGTFATKVDYTTGDAPESVSIGDYNGNGRVDVAVVNSISDSVSIFINNGNGTLTEKVDYTVGDYPASVSMGDLNGDGKEDLAVANRDSDSISILLNNGDGTFAAKVDYTTGDFPRSISIENFDNDDKEDLAVANRDSDSISILLNNGDGTFATKVDYIAGNGPVSITGEDVNGDGNGDLTVANLNSNSVSVLLNNGDGTFASKVDYLSGAYPRSVSVGNLNGDNKVDLVTANLNDDSISVLLNQPSTMFFAEASTGYVGIGTNNPNHLLDVNGQIKANEFLGSLVNYGFSTEMTTSITMIANDISNGYDGNIVFSTHPDSGFGSLTERMRIDYLGNVGIGTDNPNHLLDIAGGDIYSDQFIVANSSTGGIVTRVSAGAPTDSALNGTTVVDSTNGRMYFRYGSAWHYVNQTGGFQIPNYEVAPPDQLTKDGEKSAEEALPFESSNFPSYLTEKITPGELLIPYVDEYMQDGAAHGLYARFADVKKMMFEETDTKILILEDANKILDTKTAENITILEEIKKSTTDQLDLFKEDINELKTNLNNLEEKTEQANTLLATIDTRVISLEDQIKTLKEQNEAVIDFAIALNMESLLYKDALGNLDLGGGTLTAKDIEVENKIKGKIFEMSNETSGKGSIKAGETETQIITAYAGNDVKISITPQGSTQGKIIYYDEIIEGESFKVKIDGPSVEKDINFSWLIIK